MFDNHGYKNIVTYLSGVTDGSIRPKQISENRWFSEIFLFAPTTNRRKILKLPVCKKGTPQFVSRIVPSQGCISLFFNMLQQIRLIMVVPSDLAAGVQK